MSCSLSISRFRPASPATVWLAALLVCASASGASAQTMFNSGSQFNGGTRFSNGELNQPVSVNTRDENGNRLIVDGILRNQGAAPNVFSTGVGDSSAGAGGATAIGNNLTVTTIGSHNTVIVNSTQINNGDVTAGTVLNGSIDLESGL